MKRAIATALSALALTAVVAGSIQAQAETTYELAFGSMAPKGTPWMDLLEDVEKRLEAESNGAISVVLRPPGFMGELEMVEAVRNGERLQGAGVTTAAIAEAGGVPQLQLVELPYLFNNNAEADHVMDNLLYDEMGGVLKNRGFVLAIWTENGWRSFATKNKAVRMPEDLAGLTMRAQESDVHSAMYETYGATAVQKPMTEVLTALNAGVIDGLDNTALFIQAGGLAEPLKYFTVSRHIYQPAAVIYSRKWFDTLPPELQELCLSVKDLTESGRRAIRAEEGAFMDNFEIFDVEIIELNKEQRDAFAKKARTMHHSFAAKIDGGPQMLQKIEKSLKEKRGQ